MGKTIITATVVYAISWLLTFMVFGNAIQGLLMPVQLQGAVG